MAAMTSLTVDMFDGPQWVAAYKQLKAASNFKKRKRQLSLSPGPTAAFGIDTLYLYQFTLAASGTVTLDLTSYTDAVGQATQSMARTKGLHLWLHSTLDNTDVLTDPASGVTLGGAGSNPATLMFGDAASDKIKVLPGGQFSWWDATANGVAVSGSAKNILITNLDSSYQAIGRLLVAGSLS